MVLCLGGPPGKACRSRLRSCSAQQAGGTAGGSRLQEYLICEHASRCSAAARHAELVLPAARHAPRPLPCLCPLHQLAFARWPVVSTLHSSRVPLSAISRRCTSNRGASAGGGMGVCVLVL